MLRTIYGFTSMWIYLIYSIPTLRRVKKLSTVQFSVQERDEKVHQLPKKWARHVVNCSGARVTLNGEHHIPTESVLFVCNHQSNFDIPLLMGYLKKPMGFISKVEVKKLPIISDWMEVLPCVFMDRKDRRQAVKAIQDGANLLSDGHSLVIFPEGTRSKGGPIAPFKTGSFRLATKSGVPIVPVTINGSFRLFEEKGNLFQPGDVTITIHEPIRKEIYQSMDVKDLAQMVQDRIDTTKISIPFTP
ncbi:lysophospholipid acyltransferase family protein [Bacillus sp. DJP31]|uniref:lysophospholipid acyltransferase family protein n=1 Tax=Bacillus sp. DJP31 TaxID=3409789 RepID=UPI003BB77067